MRFHHPIVFLLLLLVSDQVRSADWPRFRGPNGDGTATSNAPTSWTEKEQAWKVKLPGLGHSSPIITGDHVIVTAADNQGGRYILSVSLASGKELWKVILAGKSYKMHKKNSIATATPATDGERVYSTWGTPDECLVLCHDLTGKELWKVNLGAYKSQHGFGMSPIVHDGMVIVYFQPDGDGSVHALDAKSGKELWKTPRQGKNATYSTAAVLRGSGREELIFTNWQHGISSLDPATGKVLWELPVFNKNTQERAIPSPLVAGDIVLGMCGFFGGQKHIVAVKVGDSSKGEKAKELWRLDRGILPQMPTPVIHDGHLYVIADDGQAQCVELATGKSIWSDRLGGQSFNSSPILLGDRLFCTAANGEVIVIKATPKGLETLGKSTLGEATQATPAVSGNRLVFRTETQLIAVGK